MTKKTKIYLNFLICFLVCMTLYILSTYLRNFTLHIFKNGVEYWTGEFIIMILISLLNGIIFENINKSILQRPELIFVMMKYLILQLYSFSLILLFIMLVAFGIGQNNVYFTEQIFAINLIIFGGYVIYIIISKKRKKKKYTIADTMKIVIGASIIFQSSLAEILFLGAYLLLLVLFAKFNILNKKSIKVFILLGGIIVILGEICILISSLNFFNKVALSIINVFIIYIGGQDYSYLVSAD